MRAFFYFSIIAIIQGCSLSEKNSWVYDLELEKKDDYMAYMNYLGESYLNTPGVKLVRLRRSSIKYLEDMYYNISKNNELVLSNTEKPSFYIIGSKIPFYFSLPNSRFFFSSGLVKRYLRNEQMLAAMLSAEIFKSINSLYLKGKKIPVGFISLEQILSLVKVPINIKAEINNNSYLILKRAGFDPSSYLVWLQAQNKNMLDFSVQHGTSRRMSKEEFLFKNFIASKKDRFEGVKNKSSTKRFFTFLDDVKGFR